jgi:hypothetical protein
LVIGNPFLERGGDAKLHLFTKYVQIYLVQLTMSLLPVSSFIWEDPANASAWVMLIAVVTGYQVDMTMRYSLARSWAVVYADVVSRRCVS